MSSVGSAAQLGRLDDRADSNDADLIAYESWLNLKEFCVPLRPPQGDLRRVFLDYLARNPAYRSGEASSVVVVALKQRYPCVTGSTPALPTPKP